MNEDQKISELLKPRIKVIAPMPLMKNEVGSLLNRSKSEDHWFGIKTNYGEHWYPIEDFKLWPCIFKTLLWYEERTVDEFPEYVKFISDREVVKPIGYDLGDIISYVIVSKSFRCNLTEDILPATEKEYNEYLNEIKQTFIEMEERRKVN